MGTGSRQVRRQMGHLNSVEVGAVLLNIVVGRRTNSSSLKGADIKCEVDHHHQRSTSLGWSHCTYSRPGFPRRSCMVNRASGKRNQGA